MAKIRLRDPSDEDVPFVLNSWLMSARNVGDNRHMSNDTYFTNFRAECVKKLKNGFVAIACNPELPSQIYGWVAVSENMDLHYVYVKEPYRKRGFASELVSHYFPEWGKKPTTVTTIGRFHREWGPKYNLVFDPYSWKSETK
jgi:hypothetical protein